MKKILMLGILFLALTSLVSAKVLQDWDQVVKSGDGMNMGVFADEDGTKISIAQTEGPSAGEKALKVTANIVQWGGVWVAVKGSISKEGAVKFKARSTQAGILQVGLTDEAKTQYVATVRILADEWQEFVVPISQFKPTKYPMKEAPRNATLNLSKIVGMQFQPQGKGSRTLSIGPVSVVAGPVVAKTGLRLKKAGELVVQDFILLEKNGCGPFMDEKTGTEISVVLEDDTQVKGGRLATFSGDIKPCGWGGYWIRAGEEWGGQDWSGAKSMVLQVSTQKPMVIEVAFNDVNQCSYTATFPTTQGTGWETIRIPFSKFELNPYYQPDECKKGSKLDLSHIETFNLSPKGQGKFAFQVREVLIKK